VALKAHAEYEALENELRGGADWDRVLDSVKRIISDAAQSSIAKNLIRETIGDVFRWLLRDGLKLRERYAIWLFRRQLVYLGDLARNRASDLYEQDQPTEADRFMRIVDAVTIAARQATNLDLAASPLDEIRRLRRAIAEAEQKYNSLSERTV